MTTATNSHAGTAKRVLLIGRSRRVLDGAVEGLEELGFEASATNDFADVTTQFDVRGVDLVVFGGAVPAELETELRARMAAIDPSIVFVKGLAGIPGLIVAQVRGAFAVDGHHGMESPTFDRDHRSIELTLPEPTDVKATVWWQTIAASEPTGHSRLLVDGRLGAGRHALPVPEDVPAEASFATVEVGASIYA